MKFLDYTFIDIHTHLLPGCDDGPKTAVESVALARSFIEQGVGAVIATPHFIPGTAWATSKEAVLETIQQLQERLRKENLPLGICPGMEIAFHRNLETRLVNNELLPLGTSDYFLLEPSFSGSNESMLAVLHDLLMEGCHFIIAHPERITSFQDNPKPLIKLVDKGLKLQVNIGSILGKFGKRSKTTGLWLLQQGAVHFLASDAHDIHRRRTISAQEWENLRQILGQNTMEKLCFQNPLELIS